MRIIDMRPELTEWREGRKRKVGNWSFNDSTIEDCQVRTIWHHSTAMGFYLNNPTDSQGWEFHPTSIGHGSVSDQMGMNSLFGFRYVWKDGKREFTKDYGYIYVRHGGARIETSDGQVVLP